MSENNKRCETIKQVNSPMGCAILAGGKSSRMGQDKALLTYGDTCFIQKLCEELDCFEEKYIARGSHPDCVKEDWMRVDDIYLERGPIGGIHAVLSTCTAEAIFFTSCDMPLLQRGLVEKICGFLEEETDAVIAVSADGRIHPLCGVYRKSVSALLEQQILSGNNRLMKALEQLQVVYLKLDDKESPLLWNINTREEYESLLSLKDLEIT
jgi:molybdopterin-guanine dinucleotide biosynthesis protein A